MVCGFSLFKADFKVLKFWVLICLTKLNGLEINNFILLQNKSNLVFTDSSPFPTLDVLDSMKINSKSKRALSIS